MNREIAKQIGLLAFDLDGTLLDQRGKLTDATKASLERAIENGKHVVIATGRALSTLPKEVVEFPGIQYAITSNGARVIDLRSGEVLYSNLLDRTAVEKAMKWMTDPEVMIEFFYRDTAYADANCLKEPQKYGIVTEKAIHYHTTTRIPCENTFETLLEHAGEMENINILFADQEKRRRYAEELSEIEDITVVSSLPFNIEIGGRTTSKADALTMLTGLLGLTQENVMAFGDSTNDAAMLGAAGFGVAMGNAVEELKAASDWITLPNSEDGVSFALEVFGIV
jgi:Cof subfamily protein (haloacid dehalogenase superfamily)